MSDKNLIILNGSLTEKYGLAIIKRLDEIAENNSEDIFFYINSPGGSLNYCFAIIERMNKIPNDVNTIVIGQASSAAATISAHGTPGKRFATTNSEIMFHQPRGTFELNAVGKDFGVSMKEVQIEMLSKVTGRTLAEVAEAITLELYLTSDKAEEFGSIDSII